MDANLFLTLALLWSVFMVLSGVGLWLWGRKKRSRDYRDDFKQIAMLILMIAVFFMLPHDSMFGWSLMGPGVGLLIFGLVNRDK